MRQNRDPIITVTVHKVSHPNRERAISLVANLVLKNFSEELEQAMREQRETAQ